MKSFFEGIADLFVNVIFKYTMDPFRFAESWAISNILNWMFMLIGSAAFIFSLLPIKLRIYFYRISKRDPIKIL